MNPWLEWRIGFGESIGCGGGRGLQMSSSLLKNQRFSPFVWRLRNKSVNLQQEKCNLIIGDAIMNTISVDSNIYRGAELYAKLHNVSIGQMVEKYLLRFQVPTSRKLPSLKLPAHLEKLCGCLAGIEDENDEKLDYLLEKYK